MKNCYWPLAGLVLLSAPVCAQSFRPGYVVMAAGDTLRGQVEFRGERRNARLCVFRPAEAAPATEYQPAQLRGYGFATGTRFETVPVRVNSASTVATPPDTLRQPVFMEVLAAGRLSLLYLRDQADAIRFYLRAGQQPARELTEHQREQQVQGRRVLRSDEEYRRLLATATRDCLTLQPDVAAVPLEAAALIALVRRYNACGSPASAPTTPATAAGGHSSRLTWSIVAGVQQGQLVYKAYSAGQQTDELSAKAGVAPMLGLALRWTPAHMNPRLSLGVAALFERLHYTGSRSVFRSFTTVDQQYETTLTGVQLPIQLRYELGRGQSWRPFVQAGAVAHLLPQVEQRIHSSSSGSVDNGWQPLTTQIRHYELGVGGSLGLLLGAPEGRNLAVALHYERNAGFATGAELKAVPSSWGLLVSYDLTK